MRERMILFACVIISFGPAYCYANPEKVHYFCVKSTNNDSISPIHLGEAIIQLA